MGFVFLEKRGIYFEKSFFFLYRIFENTIFSRYECKCYARYAGNNCQIDNGPQCDLSLCLNGGHCEETKDGDYTCTCTSNFFGMFQ